MLFFSVSLISQDIEKIANQANEYYYGKQYQKSIEQCNVGLAISGDDKGTLLYKSFIYEVLSRIYKNKDFEGSNINLSYSYLKKAAEVDKQYQIKCGKTISEKTKLERDLESMAQLYPGCEQEKVELTAETSKTQTNNQNSDKTVTITVSGSGKTQDEAKQSALHSAIEQAFGAFISAKTEILNDQVISDQITSVASGNIKSFDILNASQLPDGTWGVTLKALVSIDKLSSFVEAKGVSVEIKGGLFALNIKQQILNEKAEIKAVAEMVGLLHELMQTAFDYSIKSGEPKSVDSESKNWEIPLTVTATANKNMDFCSEYTYITLKSLSLSDQEFVNYKSLGKPIYPIVINNKVFFLRMQNSINALNTLISQWEFYTRLFTVQSGMDVTYNISKINTHNFSEKEHYDGNVGSKINFLTAGVQAGTFTWQDKRTLAEIEQMTGYTVKPRGIVSQFKHGGFVVYEKDGHGLVAALMDLGKMNWESAKTACDELALNGYSDWRLPTIDEYSSLYTKLFKMGIGGFDSMSDYWSCTEFNIENARYFSFTINASFDSKSYLKNVRTVRNF